MNLPSASCRNYDLVSAAMHSLLTRCAPCVRKLCVQLSLASAFLIVHLLAPAGVAGASQGDQEGWFGSSMVDDTNDPPSIAQTPPFSVHWPASDDRGHIGVSRGGAIKASADCASEQPCELELLISGDNGRGTVHTVSLGTIQVEPRDRVSFEVRPEVLGFATLGLDYSCSLELVARSAESGQQAVSPALFFHSEPAGGLVVYDQRALANDFNTGDLRNQHRAAREADIELGTVTSRVTHGGTGAVTFDDIGTAGGSSRAGNYKFCIRFDIRTLDSGIPVVHNGVTEDVWPTLNTRQPVKARGVRVLIERGTEDLWFDADTKGCFEWSHFASSGFSMRVYGYAIDTGGNFARIHNGSPTTTATYPGSTYSHYFSSVQPISGATQTFDAGAGLDRWTTIATAALGLYRYHDGLSGKEFHIAFDTRTSTGGNGVQHCNSSSNYATSSNRSYLRIGRCPGTSSPQTRFKFIVAHELGHAVGRQFAGVGVSSYDGSWNDGSPHSSCDPVNPVYSINSVEWSVVGFREGFAHFYAARVFNAKAKGGAFPWIFTSGAWSLERWDAWGGDNSNGGRLQNYCCASPSSCNLSGAGTNGDWLRFFWDWYTLSMSGCPQPSKLQMLKLYKTTLQQSGKTRSNYYNKMWAALKELYPNSNDCRRERFLSYADHNGINN